MWWLHGLDWDGSISDPGVQGLLGSTSSSWGDGEERWSLRVGDWSLLIHPSTQERAPIHLGQQEKWPGCRLQGSINVKCCTQWYCPGLMELQKSTISAWVSPYLASLGFGPAIHKSLQEYQYGLKRSCLTTNSGCWHPLRKEASLIILISVFSVSGPSPNPRMLNMVIRDKQNKTCVTWVLM